MTEDQIKHMVDRFLNWKLPEHFNPDGGVSFEPFGNKGMPHQYERQPSGTNLLDATQVDAMVRHMIDGIPTHGKPDGAVREALERLISDIEDYQRVNNLAPSPGKTDCWQSVTIAKAALARDQEVK